MDGFELKLDTATGKLAAAGPLPSPLSSSSAGNLKASSSLPGTLRKKNSRGSGGSSHSSHADGAKSGTYCGERTAAALIAGGADASAAAGAKEQDENYQTTLRQPIKRGKTKKAKSLSAKSLKRSASRPGSSRPGSASRKGERKSKKKSRKSIKRLAQQRELEAYRSQLRTERQKADRERENFRQKADFMRHRHETTASDKERDLCELRVHCSELQDQLDGVTAELEATKKRLAAERVRSDEHLGEDFRDANSARLSQLEEAARHLLFNVAAERQSRLHCAQCDNPLVSTHSEDRPGTFAPPDKSAGTGTKSGVSTHAIREDEQLVVYYPCRHARFCAKCARAMERCQVCSREIESKVLLINSKVL